MFIRVDNNDIIIGISSKKPPVGYSVEIVDEDLLQDYGNPDFIFKYMNKKVIKVPRPKSVEELRGREYPSISEQLDLLWHAMDVGEIPKATLWYNTIKSVKNKYPK